MFNAAAASVVGFVARSQATNSFDQTRQLTVLSPTWKY